MAYKDKDKQREADRERQRRRRDKIKAKGVTEQEFKGEFVEIPVSPRAITKPKRGKPGAEETTFGGLKREM